jgi:hypothetical protein
MAAMLSFITISPSLNIETLPQGFSASWSSAPFFLWSPAAVFESAVALLVCNSVFGLVCGPRQRSDSSGAPETRWTLALWTGISSSNRAPPLSHDQNSLFTVSHMTLMEPVVLWVEQCRSGVQTCVRGWGSKSRTAQLLFRKAMLIFPT